MMIAQASVSILVDFTRVSCDAYYFLTIDPLKSFYGKIVGLFIFQLSNVLFYIYTLASHLFRRIFSKTMLAL